MSRTPKPVVLIVLDGWGYREDPAHNAILAATTRHWDRLWAEYTHALVDASGIDVGLPQGQMGNSEVGHLNLGAGRVVSQDYTRITQAISGGSFDQKPALVEACERAVTASGAVHLMGLLSPGGVHSHEEHIVAMAELAAKLGVKRIYLHAILDGRDMPPRSAEASLKRMDRVFDEIHSQYRCRGRTASIIGRYYAMDRDQRWDRTKVAYDLYTRGISEFHAPDAVSGLHAAYARDESDEFVKPTRVDGDGIIQDNDTIVFMNYRADRARQISRAFVEDEFDAFTRERRPALSGYVCLTEYLHGLPAAVAFPPIRLKNVLAEYVSDLGLKQLRVAETEKYAHVTFFFNGGIETPFPNEDRILVPSPKVSTYDLQPEMSAPEVTDRLVQAIEGGEYDLIICNYANADMVGHTGHFNAAVKAIETLDVCLGRVAQAVKKTGGELLITSDHGNAEQMRDDTTGQTHTAHTVNKVPLLYIGRAATMKDDGTLSDIAPTLLTLMGLEQPPEMTGHSLIVLNEKAVERVS